MGSYISSILKRLFDYPIKRKPICFYRQEDFSATGEQLQKDETKDNLPPTEYSKVVKLFYMRLLEERSRRKQMQEKNRRFSVQKLLDEFPGWNEMTIANLHSLFLLFDNAQSGMLGLADFCAVLESLGDESKHEYRKSRFDQADSDKDSWISYDEFLTLVYTFNPPEGDQLRGLAKLCLEAADNISYVSSLSIGEQLEFGLF